MITINITEAQASDLLEQLESRCAATECVSEVVEQLTRKVVKPLSFDDCNAWRQYEALSVALAGAQVGELMAGPHTKTYNA
jgi:hypothetical protein